MFDEEILNIIENQKKELNEWRNELISKLKLKLNEKLDIFLINKEWLENYAKTFFDEKKENKELLIKYNNYENIDNGNLLKEINEKS